MDPPAQVRPGGDGEPPLVVHVPRKQILAETGLAHMYRSVTCDNGLVKTCVLVDVPEIPGRPEKSRAFYGEPKGDLGSAVESAAEVALRHLCDEYGLVINDYNYSAMVESREQLLTLLESNRKMEAENEAKQKEAICYKELHDGLVQELKDFCIQFPGLLPVRVGGPCGVEYVGPPSPTDRNDKLALDFVQHIQSAYVEYE